MGYLLQTRGWLYNPNHRREVRQLRVSETLTPLPRVQEPEPQNADGWYRRIHGTLGFVNGEVREIAPYLYSMDKGLYQYHIELEMLNGAPGNWILRRIYGPQRHYVIQYTAPPRQVNGRPDLTRPPTDGWVRV